MQISNTKEEGIFETIKDQNNSKIHDRQQTTDLENTKMNTTPNPIYLGVSELQSIKDGESLEGSQRKQMDEKLT